MTLWHSTLELSKQCMVCSPDSVLMHSNACNDNCRMVTRRITYHALSMVAVVDLTKQPDTGAVGDLTPSGTLHIRKHDELSH